MENLFDQNLDNNFGLGADKEVTIPDPMDDLIPVTLVDIEFERHEEVINNIGRFGYATVETHCIITIEENKFVIRSGENDPKEKHTIIGRSITHDIDELDVIEKEKAYNDALNKLHMLGFKLDDDSTANIVDEEKQDLSDIGNLFEEAEQPKEIPDLEGNNANEIPNYVQDMTPPLFSPQNPDRNKLGK